MPLSQFLFPRRIAPLLLALLGVLLVMLPYGVLQQRSYITIDDNLDAELNIPYLLVSQKVVFNYDASAVVVPIMNGLPRNALRPGLSATVAFFEVLPPWAAYLAHQLAVRLLGLLSLYALLRRCWLPGAQHKVVLAVLALAWALLPLYSMYGLSVLGQPALLLAFLELRRGSRQLWPWQLIGAFPLWSIFVFVGPFVLAALGVFTLWDAWQARQLNWRLVAGLLLLTGMYVVVEWPLFYSLLVARQFVPHRVEFDLARLSPTSIGAGLRSTVQYLLFGQYHASRFFRGLIVVAVVVAMAQARGSARRRLVRQFLGWGAVLVAVALFCGLYVLLMGQLQKQVPLLGAFNFNRLHFLTPLLWFAVLALALQAIQSPRLRLVLAAGQLAIGLIMNPEWVNNLRELAGRPLPQEPNYAAYVAPGLFQTIRQTIQTQTGLRPAQYRVACLGLPPAIAQLNDFYTLDSYQNNYPLAYKKQFRPIIAGELAKSPLLRTYFDNWGNRCYLFSAELGKDFRVGAAQKRVVQDFAFDAAAFRQLGGRYVLSAVRLAAPAQSGLRLAAVFEQPGAFWRIHLYEVAL